MLSSLLMFVGRKQIHELVQEKSIALTGKNNIFGDCKSELDQKDAKTQEMPKEFSSMKQETMVFTRSLEEASEKPNEGSKGSSPLTTSRKKVFIRSRL